jgi:glucoamylase
VQQQGALRAAEHGPSWTFYPPRARKVRSIAIVGVGLMIAVAVAGLLPIRHPGGLRLYAEGIAEKPCYANDVIVVPTGSPDIYVANSSVLAALSGGVCAQSAIRADETWLQSGVIPGSTVQLRSMATRALLDLHLSVRPNGAVIAGWQPNWNHSWPRDSSWVAAALAYDGHGADAYSILRFLQRTQLPNGWWAARYSPDGRPVDDGRPDELDADGWALWAVWAWSAAMSADGHDVSRELSLLWPMVKAAAGATLHALTPDGLPVAAMDYQEHGEQVSLGTAAPLLAGLRAAVDIGRELGAASSVRSWSRAAVTLADGIQAGFGRYGYHRLAYDDSGSDAAVTFLGPPFESQSFAVDRAATHTRKSLALPNGGLLPGSAWPGNTTAAWTAETAFFALFSAETGDHQTASRILRWLAAHRTRAGSLPEMVNASGAPVSVAPLAWTDAVVLLALLAQRHPLPAIPGAGL